MKLSYRWFVNGTDVGERSKDINFTVTKNHQYNQYSCEALEKNLVSERSDPIQINPLCKILYVCILLRADCTVCCKSIGLEQQK